MTSKLFVLLLFWNSVIFSQTKSFTPKNTTVPAGTERRFALVIGNKDYSYMGTLKNPLNDAVDMTTALQNLGFEVITANNADYRTFMQTIAKFKEKLTNSDVAFFYYSGHGTSFGGQNYLLPVDADIDCLEQVEIQGISLNRVLGEIASKNVKTSFVMLDACRNIPQALKVCDNTKRDLFNSKGLIKPSNNPRGSLVVYSTEEGSTADDAPSTRNGLFTGALLKYLTVPNLTIRNIIDNAAIEVENRSNGKQSPANYDKIRGDFYFLKTKIIEPTQKVDILQPIEKSITSESVKIPETNVPVKKVDIIVPVKSTTDQLFMPMVFIKGGTFMMGDTRNEGESDEKPVHQVTLGDFSMGKYEVTQRQWEDIMGSNPSYFKDCAECPVETVNWNDVQEFLKRLNEKTGVKYRLPTEAEWEYAAGGGSTNRTKFGNSKDVLIKGEANFDGIKTRIVGSFSPNCLGLYDMSGNVWELCEDWYGEYSISTEENPSGAEFSPTFLRVIRGGSWYGGDNYDRISNRMNTRERNNNIGFRVVASQ